jgi:orotate phosphoribosyltransferase
MITGLLVQRRGHFRMESGYHTAAWFELGSLFDHPDELSPSVTELARRLASHGVDSVCGPMTGGAKLARLIATELRVECFEAERLETPGTTGLFPVRYELPETQRQRARERSVAIVDDAISAGSAVRGTFTDLVAAGGARRTRCVRRRSRTVRVGPTPRARSHPADAARDVGSRRLSTLRSACRDRPRQCALITAGVVTTGPRRSRSRRSRAP